METEYNIDYEKEKSLNCGVGALLSGYFKIQVVDAETGKIVEDRPWQKNLILNCGLNAVATQYFGNLNLYGICGSGSRPNSFGSGLSTITQSGYTMELYERTGDITSWGMATSSYGDILEVGDMIQYSNGSESMVIEVVDQYKATMSHSYNLDETDQQTFRIWKTSQSDLEMESKRGGGNGVTIPGSSYLVGTGNCGSTLDATAGTQTYRRTYDFVSESKSGPTRTYTEAGVSWTATKGTNSVFSRALLSQSVDVVPGQLLRLIHDLRVSYTPKTPRYITASIGHWPTSGYATESLQVLVYTTPAMDTNGGLSTDWWWMAGLEPASSDQYTFTTFLSSTSTPLAALGSYVSRANLGYHNGYYFGPYVNDSFERIKSSSFNLTTAASDSIRCFGVGCYRTTFQINVVPWDNGQYLTVIYDQPQTKLNTQKLHIIWKYRWGRVLA